MDGLKIYSEKNDVDLENMILNFSKTLNIINARTEILQVSKRKRKKKFFIYLFSSKKTFKIKDYKRYLIVQSIQHSLQNP